MKADAKAAAAIEILDLILQGYPLKKVLLNWFRKNRFAGSKDRAHIQDIVYNGYRRKMSSLWLFKGQKSTVGGRALVLVALFEEGEDLNNFFTGIGYGAAKVNNDELYILTNRKRSLTLAPDAVRLDVPEFLLSDLKNSLGTHFEVYLEAMKFRAPFYLRVNKIKAAVDDAEHCLNAERIITRRHRMSKDCLEVIVNLRKVKNSEAYQTGKVEIQDLSSQLAVQFCCPPRGTTVLDYCAGGGGKTLALASIMGGQGKYYLSDKNYKRMEDFPRRLKRAGFYASIIRHEFLAPENHMFDFVLVDAPCTGSGVWRRNPSSKWNITPEKLTSFLEIQKNILDEASNLVKNGGTLVYMTCSILNKENFGQIENFLCLNKSYCFERDKVFSSVNEGDGFYVAVLKKSKFYS